MIIREAGGKEKQIVCWLLLAMAVSMPCSTALAKRFPSDTSPEVQASILGLEESVGYNVATGIIAKEYSSEMLDSVLGALGSREIELKTHALRLLVAMLTQLNVPRETLTEVIVPAVRAAMDEGNLFGGASASISQIGKQILWEIEYRTIVDAAERIAFLRSHIETRRGVSHYSIAAMNYLAELGSEEARAVLLEELNEAVDRGVSGEHVARLKMALQKLELVMQLQRPEANKRVERLLGTIRSVAKQQTPFTDELVVWAIRQLAITGGRTATRALKEIWRDDGYAYEYRFEAQEALIRLGAIAPGERVLGFQ